MTTYLAKPLITASSGQLGTTLVNYCQQQHIPHAAYTHQELDITNFAALKSVIEKQQPSIILNTAAYTAVDKAETERDLANQINHRACQHLAELAEQFAIPLVHFSTDYIFAGDSTTAYVETDIAKPVNYYGETKWLGEEAVRHHLEKHLILRISAVFSPYRHNFVKTILRLLAEKPELRIVADQITCPTATDVVAEGLFTMLNNPQWGTYHFCQAPPTSWYNFAKTIAELTQSKTPVLPQTSLDYPTPAKRPAYSVLNCDKLYRDYGIKPLPWRESLQKMLAIEIDSLSHTTSK